MIINCKCNGFYRFAKKVGDKDIMVFNGEKSDNLILDAFLNAVNSNTINAGIRDANIANIGAIGLLSSARIGTDITEPSASDVGLFNSVMSSSNATVTDSSLTYDSENDEFVFSKTVRIEFAPATSNYNIGEACVYSNNAASNSAAAPIVSRVLTKVGGVPTTIPLNIDEIFVLFYTLEVRSPRSVTANINIKGIPTLIEAVFTTEQFTGSVYWPFSSNYRINIANNTAIHFRTTTFTLPVYNNYPSYSGWSYAGTVSQSITYRTPLNPDTTGYKLKPRIGLAYCNSPNVYGLASSASSASFTAPAWFFKFTPPFNKSSSEVFDIEFFSKLSRV